MVSTAPEHRMWCVARGCAHSTERSAVESVSAGVCGGSEVRQEASPVWLAA